MDKSILILGAGCSGTAMALALRRKGFCGQLTLIDSRSAFDREQRWCFWAHEVGEELAPLIRHQWEHWKVYHDTVKARRSSGAMAYHEIYAPDYFRKMHGLLESEPNTRLCLGHSVRSLVVSRSCVAVTTDQDTFRADRVIDTRNLPTMPQKSESVNLGQSFLGRHIKASPGTFDRAAFTWMDFRLPQTNGALWFGYVLPYSDTEALVEVAAIWKARPSADVHEKQLRAYEELLGINTCQVLRCEEGFIPMQSEVRPVKISSRHYQTGIMGGCARPSSGYAFLRIQQQTDALASHLVRGTPVPSWKLRPMLLDRIFLQALQDQPLEVGRALATLLARMQAKALLAFFNEQSSLWQDFLALACLPKVLFSKALASILWKACHQKIRPTEECCEVSAVVRPVTHHA